MKKNLCAEHSRSYFGRSSSSLAWYHGSLRCGKIVSNFVMSSIKTRFAIDRFPNCLRGCDQSALLHSPESLVGILMRASTIAQDRRKTRYPRLRKAVEAGLEPASVLSAKQPKGKRRRKRNDAVVPDLTR